MIANEPDLLHILKLNDPELREKAASSLYATPKVLKLALMDEDWEVRKAAAVNPKANIDVLYQALKSYQPLGVREIALTNPKVSVDLLKLAVQDKEWSVRWLSIQNPKADIDIIKQGLEDPQLAIRNRSKVLLLKKLNGKSTMTTNPITEIKKVVKFTGATLTKMKNAAANYALPIARVKEIYIESINEVVQSKDGNKEVAMVISRFSSDDYRQIWFRFVNKCQAVVKEEGGSRKGAITKLENKTKEIIANDIRRLKIRIAKLKVKVKALKGVDKKEAQEFIDKYENFIEYTETDRAINHFINKLKVNPELTSFVFKAKK